MSKAENIKAYYKRKHYNQKLAQRLSTRRFESSEARIYQNIVNRISSEIASAHRKHTIKDLIGCTQEELITHLCSQFAEGMTINNYPEWEPDHILPVASFNLKSEADQIACFHFKNLQPLWRFDNRSKGKRTE